MLLHLHLLKFERLTPDLVKQPDNLISLHRGNTISLFPWAIVTGYHNFIDLNRNLLSVLEAGLPKSVSTGPFFL